MKLVRIHANALAYSMTTLGSGMLSTVFNFYYMQLFLKQYKISEAAFHQSQVIFMIWNAFNDPLFGYIQDNSKASYCSGRQTAILYGAPFYALAFLLPWFPWKQYHEGDWLSGLHLVVSLCAFDGMLTFVQLAQCALFAEISTRHESRLQLIKYNQVASLVGSTSILFCGLISDNMENLPYFQAFSIVIAVLATACLFYTGIYSMSHYELKRSPGESTDSESESELSWSSVILLTKQILTQKNFLLFLSMNFFQVFHLTFFNNFMMIFADNLIPKDAFSSSMRSIMYGAGFICPQFLVLISHSWLKKFGYYKVILFSFYIEGAAAAVMFILGQEHYYILAFYLTASMVVVQASFSLFNLPLADIIDADVVKFNRKSPLSSMVFGTNALFTKPAQSLAPMVIVTVLNQFGYEQLNKTALQVDPSLLTGLHDAMFILICLLPLGITVIQILAWTPFSIRSSHHSNWTVTL
ncbi:transmembrane protein 180-like [Gracilinanus agilis]|uniref:transmembrane protein 180-like n=1 Tax=Gracilinanus agilis TaxID=191870 RepID=UPI001CFDC4C4|nr:transmembrane protein 180-like [Gracilinanus agilis]